LKKEPKNFYDLGCVLTVDVELEVTHAPTSLQRDSVLHALRVFATAAVGRPDDKAYAVLVREGAQGDIAGGLIAYSRWQEFFIDLIALPEHLRGQGLGARLLSMAEAEARVRGCSLIWLDSYAFQSNGFYERHGFEVFATFDGPGPIYPRLFFKKGLLFLKK
jgi:GNAT superfamily N-acetyltransferase